MLNNKVAVITGGSRGIGKAISLKFAENGADIAIIDIADSESANETVREIESLGVRSKLFTCNIADYNETMITIKQIVDYFGRVDILVNNAGITRDKLVMSMKENDFDDVIGVNLKGTFNAIKHVYPIFAKQRSGKIINISSVSGMMGNPGQANYSASKAGIIGLTKSVAKELASRGVCCNAIAPGFIKTSMTQNLSEDNQLIANIPMKRFGTPGEVSSLALFLASDLSDYITGEVIRIDGGLAM